MRLIYYLDDVVVVGGICSLGHTCVKALTTKGEGNRFEKMETGAGPGVKLKCSVFSLLSFSLAVNTCSRVCNLRCFSSLERIVYFPS